MRLSCLQEDSPAMCSLDPAASGGYFGPSSPILSAPNYGGGVSWQLQQYGGSSSGSSGGGGSSSGGGSSGLGPRLSSGGGLGSSYLGGLTRGDGTESPSRPRRTISAPGAQLQQLALQHVKSSSNTGIDSSTSSPRYYTHSSSLAARVGNHPQYTNMALDVSAAAAAAGVAGGASELASAGPMSGSACDTPDSQSSPHVSCCCCEKSDSWCWLLCCECSFVMYACRFLLCPRHATVSMLKHPPSPPLGLPSGITKIISSSTFPHNGASAAMLSCLSARRMLAGSRLPACFLAPLPC